MGDAETTTRCDVCGVQVEGVWCGVTRLVLLPQQGCLVPVRELAGQELCYHTDITSLQCLWYLSSNLQGGRSKHNRGMHEVVVRCAAAAAIPFGTIISQQQSIPPPACCPAPLTAPPQPLPVPRDPHHQSRAFAAAQPVAVAAGMVVSAAASVGHRKSVCGTRTLCNTPVCVPELMLPASLTRPSTFKEPCRTAVSMGHPPAGVASTALFMSSGSIFQHSTICLSERVSWAIFWCCYCYCCCRIGRRLDAVAFKTIQKEQYNHPLIN